MTAAIVPVWSMTRRKAISGVDGSRPISFSAMMTWAELETGSSSAAPSDEDPTQDDLEEGGRHGDAPCYATQRGAQVQGIGTF